MANLTLEMAQKQVLSQEMIQSVEILQMSSQELTEYMKELTMENPVIELEEYAPENKVDERLKKLEWLESLDDQNRTYYQYDREESDENNMENQIVSREYDSLADSLHSQLIGKNYTETEMAVFDYIGANLDSQGYYTQKPEELAQEFDISSEKAEECLAVMRDLEPTGVCAASLTDCLLKQLEKDADSEVERCIVADYLDLLGKNQLPVIAKKLKVSVERVKQALQKIQSLNPRPAQGFDNGEQLRMITPDITIVKLQDRFEILLNNYSCPVIHMNKDYMRILRSDCDEETKEYLYGKVEQIKHLQDHISRRNHTLLELAKCILDVQKDFFIYGNQEVKPFLMKDAAERLQVHESTISRAVKDKYLQCCWGIYPLSYFFSRELAQQDGRAAASVHKVKQELKNLIAQEDKAHPMSDQKLCDAMGDLGYELSRRTVTKYREAMGIPNGRQRKQY